jgi:class 3 adenylate cyclase
MASAPPTAAAIEGPETPVEAVTQAADHARDVAARSPITLRFRDRALEREFLEFHSELAALHQRIAAVLGSGIFLAGILWVQWLVPASGGAARRLILTVAIPVLALTFAVSFVKISDVARQLVAYLDLCATAGTVLGIYLATPADALSPMGTGAANAFQVAGMPALFLIIVVTVTYVRMRFLWSLGTGPLLIIGYLVVAVSVDTPEVLLQANAIALAGTTGLGASLAYMVESYTRTGWIQQRQVELERQRSDDLLHNILPAAIVDRVKAGEHLIADRHADATVVFADIVGFTPLADGREPQEVVRLLAALVVELDQIADRHGLEKIKTIGDAFMAVAGAPEAVDDHADRAMAAAADMLQVTHQVAQRLGYDLELRIGLDSGPLVAGIIGMRKLAYDLWGDTVNTASRMESHGVPGVVQLTEGTRQALHEEYELTCRDVEVKGKGPMRTWLWRPAA